LKELVAGPEAKKRGVIMVDAPCRASAERITAVMPFFG